MEQTLIDMLYQFAHQPYLVYGLVFAFMYASSFGFPVPEEVVLLTLGFLAHMAMNPEMYPPTASTVSGGVGGNAALLAPAAATLSNSVNVHIAAWLAFVAVVSSDFLVYGIGRTVGEKVLKHKWVAKVMTPERQEKVYAWTNRFGPWAAGVFRFTPGVRFPGHLSCGILKVPAKKFLAVDCFAALISVPTQVYLVAFYGKEIIDLIKKYQIWVLGALGVFLLWHFRESLLSVLKRKPSETTSG